MLDKVEKANESQASVAQQLAEERLGFDQKLMASQQTVREWAAKQVGENYADYDRLLTAKMID